MNRVFALSFIIAVFSATTEAHIPLCEGRSWNKKVVPVPATTTDCREVRTFRDFAVQYQSVEGKRIMKICKSPALLAFAGSTEVAAK